MLSSGKIDKSYLFLICIFSFFIFTSLLCIESIPIPLTRLLQISTIVLFVFSYCGRLYYAKSFFYNFTILLSLIWGLGIIMRGDYSTPILFFRNFYNFHGVFEYLAPLLFLFPFYRYFREIKDITIFTLKLYVFLIFLMLPVILFSKDFGIPVFSMLSVCMGYNVFFLIVFLDYLKTKEKRVVYVTSFIVFLLCLYLARRGMLLNLFLVYAIHFFMNLSRKKQPLLKFNICFISAVFLGGIFYITFQDTLLANIIEKGTLDTRSIVEIAFWEDMLQSPSDIICGRGIDGSYYCPYVDEGEDYRYSIETGYLHLILKGGVVYLLLVLLLFLFPIIKGLFFDKSRISKCAALYLLQHLLFIYPANNVTFQPRFILAWICISFIYFSKHLDYYNENRIR